MAEDALSLLSLEDELTCSICLSPFEGPVTLPCGHNFCRACLEETWKESFILFCPQCRHHFPNRPELKKNTVLSAVVDTLRAKTQGGGRDPEAEPGPPAGVRCDTCMAAAASKTCLTCMASFCEEHVRPHQENPTFRAHQLCAPLADLQERICTDHCKTMEFFCEEHAQSICSTCLQQVHRGCKYTTPEERRAQKEADMLGKRNFLNGKIEKNHQVIFQMKEQQTQLKDAAALRKRTLSAEYQIIRALLERDEQEALKAVDKDQESGDNKLQTLIKKFGENISVMDETRDQINSHLSQIQSQGFLQATVELPANAKFDPYSPRMNVDSKVVQAYQQSAVALKEMVSRLLNERPENRASLLKLGVTSPIPPLMATNPPPPNPRSPSPGHALKERYRQPHQKKDKEPKGDNTQKDRGRKGEKKKQLQPSRGTSPFPNRTMDLSATAAAAAAEIDAWAASMMKPVGNVKLPMDVSNAVKRSDLLKYYAELTLDVRTAHNRIILSENFTKATVSDELAPYPDSKSRFSVCSQVLCNESFSRGRHYWEVKMSNNKFCGLGVAYASIDRKGPSSRLGRNAQSWCVEWFNVKLSAWHFNAETVLINPNPSRVGVLLDCDGGSITFYMVADRAYPFHSFVFPFTEAVYPGFWIFSAGSAISLCKRTN
ncbi:E3 ubiquitin/ISG15 ligase TRIM25 [Denticeps clupeoides]|uniref:RING-type E3 ubiquitin transferase n=1 Tax=Denticeps clupeoides TaxID=299321 RepID=A0AAY4AGQ8_9TELE|nr:E3 ubiquitin/ISG15 ligase TRIM25 [Denticeps clupeoides]XP_028827610.1 E3 ubiquitin/ISG15 ligase TRIM25 [Denticeps clupeoides]XP_028827611.1 E3 ubiquitin/ISG15 ligase TRIM25 [Denticeps clupeoides]